jgi:type III restriction enzyme
MSAKIDRLIISSPYEEPASHWSYNRETREFTLLESRRPAGYVRASEASKTFDDPGIFVPLPLVNQIRTRIKAWRENPNNPYAGTTGMTKRLLEHWRDSEQRIESRRLFFCQLEAIETLIWLTEAPASERQGIQIPGDGGDFVRYCCKMATGSGKTIVMGMIIAWHILNKATYPQDKRFSKNVFIVAPGLTVKNRLQVLLPAGPRNYYDEFNLIPVGLRDKLRQGKVLIHNWHALMPLDPEDGPRVVKKGPESDLAFTKRVMGEMASAENILVINDEAHHAWRVPPKSRIPGVKKEDLEEATLWIGGLNRIHKTRGILACYDLSATPFAPTGRVSGEETLFEWIVSDFGLNDAIECGLVKTPRVVVRDDLVPDARTYKSRLYHIYMDQEVKDDLTRRAGPDEPLPDLVSNAYHLLGKDWLETAKAWRANGVPTPPVLITVANRTETAARVYNAFVRKRVRIDELAAAEKTLHIDSKVLDEAEAREGAPEDISEAVEEEDGAMENGMPKKKLSKKDQAELLRRTVDTIGQPGRPGEHIQNVISVGMLSEGWDAKTVTHIMGLRAFTSQLLCEQVVGRGLRRTAYEVNPETGLFEPEYVNIFGVPFTFLPHEGGQDGPPPPPPKPRTEIKPAVEKARFEISWPNIVRIDHDYRPVLTLDMDKVKRLVLDAGKIVTQADMAPILEGKPDLTKLAEIELESLGRNYRMQRILFEAVRDVFDQMRPSWKGNKDFLLAQIFRIVQEYLDSDRIQIDPPLFNQEPLRRRVVLTLSMRKIVQHIWEAINFNNALRLVPVFDTERPIRSTKDMFPWHTSKPVEYTKRSHINHVVLDSAWEACEAFKLDHDKNVQSWVKNDHLGFEVLYVFGGVVKKYRPDFIIRLTNGKLLVLEVKGQDSQENKTKREFLGEWVRAVNGQGGFGHWAWDVSRTPTDVPEILHRHGLR